MECKKVLKQDYFGDGIVKLNDKNVFVSKALKDDVIKMELTDIKANFSRARITELVSLSPEREEVKCLYYNECGGCHILHQKYFNQLEFKVRKVKEILKHQAGIDFNLTIDDIVYEDRYNYRNKVVLHDLGFYKRESNNVVKIDKCLLLNDRINDVIAILIKRSLVPKEVMIRVSNFGEMLVVINGHIDNDILDLLRKRVTVLFYNGKFITDRKFIIEKIDNYKFKISTKSFFQVNYLVMMDMYRYITSLVRKVESKKVLDLYCGTGTIGILISKYVDSVIGIEVIEEAFLDCNYNKEINGIDNISFFCAKVSDKINDFKDIDLIIVDPPRSGLDRVTIDSIMTIGAKNIIYTSCDISTFARDINILKEKYSIISIKLFDMFANTYHVECVTLLSLKDAMD